MNALPMDTVREALELAVKEHWDQAPRTGSVREEPASAEPHPPEYSVKKSRVVEKAEPAARVEPARNRARMAPPGSEGSLVKNRLVAADMTNPQREAYCLLQTAISRRMAADDFHSLGVTSPRTGHGKTLTAINLAISLVREAGHQVLLVDLNLRQPKVYEFFDRKPSAGIEGCLFGGVQIDDALFTSSVDGLLVLPARGDSQNAPQVLRSENLRALLADARHRYPSYTTVVDLPPLSAPQDAQVFESLVEALVLVVDDRVTKEADFKNALTALDRSKLVGTVLNNSKNLV